MTDRTAAMALNCTLENVGISARAPKMQAHAFTLADGEVKSN